MQLPTPVSTVLSALRAGGFESFVVGGCVRDFSLGKTPGDYDVATSALPSETLECFKAYRTVDNGIKHGTVTVVVDGTNIEVTTFRIDGEYADNRHPDAVLFTKSLMQDLSRRDFTVNAMAYSPDTGLADFFDGQKHLHEKKIVCVGDPHERFCEDGLRIMRALRFASVLDFSIDSTTADAVKSDAALLKNISAERIFSELIKLLCGVGAQRIVCEYADVLSVAVPEIAEIASRGLICHAAHTLSHVPGEQCLRLAALFHCAAGEGSYEAGAATALAALRRLKSDNRTAAKVCTLIQLCGKDLSPSERNARRLIAASDIKTSRELLVLLSACAHGDEKRLRSLSKMSAMLDTVEREKQCTSKKELAVCGSDLKRSGIAPGERMGEILDTLYDAVLDGEIINEKQALLSEAARLYKS